MLFINPGVLPETQPDVFKPFFLSTFPISIGYLAGYVRENNKINIRIYDEQISWLTENKLRNEIEKIDGPKIVCITCLTPTAKRVYELTRSIKKIDIDTIVILGGIHPTVVPEECLSRSSADIVVRREGEETLSEIYTAVQEKKDLKEIKGISYKSNGNIVHNPQRELIRDLSKIPPFPYDLFEKNINNYRNFGSIVSSRGCPYSCIFCSQRAISGQQYRFLPTYRVINKIKLLVDKYNQTKIFFYDDTFTINKKRTFALLDEIISSGYHNKASFIIESRGKEITWELLMKMKEANISVIEFGAETGSERLMSTLNKREKVEDIIKGIELTHKAGIGTDASFIMGLPTETKEQRKISSKLARKIPLNGARFNIAIPYPGTKLYEIAIKEDRLKIMEDWTNFSNQHYMTSENIPYTPVGTNESELIYDVFMANLKFNLMPQKIYKLLFDSFGSGGGVIALPTKWYYSPKIWHSIIKLLIFLLRRSITIVIKGGVLSKLKPTA